MTTNPIAGAMMTDDDILRLVAEKLGNPLLFEDLKEDFTVHTEAEDWIKFARALLSASKPAAIDGQGAVAWMTDDGRVATDETKRSAMANSSKPAFNIPLYAAPQPSQPAEGGDAPSRNANDDARDAAAFRILRDLMTWDVDELNSARARWSLAFTCPYGLSETEDDLRDAVESWENDHE